MPSSISTLVQFPVESDRSFISVIEYRHNFTTSVIGACWLPITDYEKLRAKFIAHGITADVTSQSEFDRYLAARAAEACDAMQWREANAHRYRNTARLAKQYLSVPATSAVSEQRFSAARRLISKLRSRLDPDRVDTIIFLYKNS